MEPRPTNSSRHGRAAANPCRPPRLSRWLDAPSRGRGAGVERMSWRPVATGCIRRGFPGRTRIAMWAERRRGGGSAETGVAEGNSLRVFARPVAAAWSAPRSTCHDRPLDPGRCRARLSRRRCRRSASRTVGQPVSVLRLDDPRHRRPPHRRRVHEPGAFFAQFARAGFNFDKYENRGLSAISAPTPMQRWRSCVLRRTRRRPHPDPSPRGSARSSSTPRTSAGRLGLPTATTRRLSERSPTFYKSSNTLIGAKNQIAGLALRADEQEWSSGTGPAVEALAAVARYGDDRPQGPRRGSNRRGCRDAARPLPVRAAQANGRSRRADDV